MITPDSIKQTYRELLNGSSNPRQRESLERINRACDYLQEHGLRISPSAVERYCLDHDWSGPKAQSIRNSSVLNKYVSLRGAGQTLKQDRKAAKTRPLIPDQTLRAYVQLLEEERDQAKAARTRIEAGLRQIPGIPVDDLIRVGFGGTALIRDNNTGAKLSGTAIDAIRLLFTEEHLSECGLQLYRDRLRQSLTGNVLLEKKHVEALRNLLSISDGDSNTVVTKPS